MVVAKPSRRVDDVASRCAALDAGRACRWIDGDGAHLRQIDHDTILAQRSSREIMPPTTNGERKPMRTRPTNGVRHVLRIRTANNRRWPSADVPIPERARLFIGCVPWEDKLADEERCEIIEMGAAASWCGYQRMWREDPAVHPRGGSAARRQALPTTGHPPTRCAILAPLPQGLRESTRVEVAAGHDMTVLDAPSSRGERWSAQESPGFSRGEWST